MGIRVIESDNNIISLINQSLMSQTMRNALLGFVHHLDGTKMTLKDISELEKQSDAKQGILISALCWLQMRDYIKLDVVEKDGKETNYYSLVEGLDL